MGYTFSDIFIGVPDGETEAKNELFEKLFCDYNKRYEELKTSSSKFLVLGSKGSGKTYLANYICRQNEPNCYRKIISGKDFLVEKLGELTKENMCKGYMYAFCSWYLYKKIAEYIIEINKLKSKYCPFSKLYKLRKFYNSYNAEQDIFSIVKKTVTKEVATSKKNGSGYGGAIESELKASVSASKSKEKAQSKRTEILYEMEKKDFYELLNHFSRLVLEAIDSEKEICLIIDDLDELDYFVTSNAENNVTINLIKAAKEINGIFQDKGIKAKIILLVRSDIINKLQLYDMNLGKTKSSCGVELYWLTNTQTSPEEHPLMHMVLHKIRASCGKLKNYSDRELFNLLFPEKIDGKPPLDFLLDHSFGRPRDIVTYLSHVIQEFPSSKTFSATELKAVRKLYSSDLYDEILNQTYYHKKPEYTEDCMKLISGMKRSSFTVEQVKEYYEVNKTLFPHIDSVENALSYLYEMSVIGNVWDGGKMSSWSYRKDSLSTLDLTKKMTIHYALRKKFSIQK